MASEFALSTAKKFADKTVEILGGVGVLEVGVVATTLDAELQEVREVLEGLQTFQMNLGSEGTERHWCKPDGGCDVHCQRARDLMERIKNSMSTGYAPMYSSHGHERKTHIAESGGSSLCGIERRYPDLLWTQGVDYYNVKEQFLIDADGHGCLRCRKHYAAIRQESTDEI